MTGMVIDICTIAILACTPVIARGLRSGTMTGMGITANSIAHVRLTVSDIERSRQFYESVFGWPVLIEIPDNADAATREQLAFRDGGVIYDMGGALIALRPVATDRFHEDRCGLDIAAFKVGADELERTLQQCILTITSIGRQRSGHRASSILLEFRDPDNIALG